MRRLVLSNSHGGNRAVLDTAGLRLRDELGMLVVTANYFLFPRPSTVELPEGEWRHGIHGGAVETAMMMHVRPDLVRADQLQDAPSLGAELEGSLRQVSPERDDASFAWLAGDLTPTGVTGNPALASADLGSRRVEHYGQLLADVIHGVQFKDGIKQDAAA